MFNVDIKSEKSSGYDTPLFSWECVLCGVTEYPNLELSWVSTIAMAHLINAHRVLSQKIKIVVMEVPDGLGLH